MSKVAAPVERLADHVAAEWLLAHDRGLTAAETRAFEMWLARSPTHADAWANANSLWDALEQESDPTIDSLLVSARSKRPPIVNTATMRAAAAVIAVVAVGLGGLVWQARHSNTHAVADNAAAPTRYAAGAALTEVKLADGTGVVLDVGSEIEVHQTALSRNVRLTKGQGFFTVVHDPKRPFVVAARDTVITDVGTAFAVSLDQNETSVVLASGKVQVVDKSRVSQPANLLPGQQYVKQDGRSGTVTPADVDARLAWRNGQMELDDTPLAEAVADINRHAKTRIAIGDPKAARLKLTGRYRLDDPIGFAQSIAAIYPVQVRTRGDGGLEIRSR